MGLLKVLLLLFSFHALAEKAGVVTVLEAPLFREPDQYSKVIQYVRKGKEIYLHPTDYERLTFERENIETNIAKYQEKYPDQLFTKDKVYLPEEDFLFYKTIDNEGRVAYILREHVILRTNDSREKLEEPISPDPTEYRIEEPLPATYPFMYKADFRGHYSLMTGRLNGAVYDYTEPIQNTGFDLQYGIDIVGTWPVAFDKSERFYFGAQFIYLQSQTTVLTDSFEANESVSTASLGPIMTYDMFRKKDWLVTGHLGLLLNFAERLSLTQRFSNASIETSYSGVSFGSRFGASFHLKDVLFGLNGFFDTSFFLKLPHRLERVSSSGSATKASLDRPFTGNMTISFGIEQVY
jgi:hypothetical protein